MNLLACADASLVIKLIVAEPDSDQALRLWQSWLQACQTICAPQLLTYEVASSLRRRVWRGMLTPQEAASALEDFLALDVTLTDPVGLGKRALELADRFHRPNAYDAHYLALAEMLGCDLWTADEKLYNTVRSELDWIRWLGNWFPPDEGPLPQ